MPLHVSSTCARNMKRHEIKLIVKQMLCIKLVKYCDKYTEMHSQQNVKICVQLFTTVSRVSMGHNN